MTELLEGTAALGRHISTMTVDDDERRARVVAAFQDTAAVIAAGWSEPAVTAVRRAAVPAVPSWDALVLGTAAHALDFDDVVMPALAHPSAVLVPAILALGAKLGSSAADCLAAYCAGFETLCVLGLGVNPEHYAEGWHTTVSLGTMAAAAACARLLRLDPAGCVAAIGIAGSMSGGSKKHFGTQLKHVHAGLAARQGMLAAELACAGITADPEPLLGRWGMADLLTGADDAMRSALQELHQKPSALLRFGVWTKRYPCCASAHRAMDGLARLKLAEPALGREWPAEIHVTLPEHSLENLPYSRPVNSAEARFSLPYCLFLAWSRSSIGRTDFEVTSAALAAFDTFVHSVRLRFETWPAGARVPHVDAGPDPCLEVSRIRVLDSQGREFEEDVGYPLGHPANPLSEEALWTKFSDGLGGDEARNRRFYEMLGDTSDAGYAGNVYAALQDVLATR